MIHFIQISCCCAVKTSSAGCRNLDFVILSSYFDPWTQIIHNSQNILSIWQRHYENRAVSLNHLQTKSDLPVIIWRLFKWRLFKGPTAPTPPLVKHRCVRETFHKRPSLGQHQAGRWGHVAQRPQRSFVPLLWYLSVPTYALPSIM